MTVLCVAPGDPFARTTWSGTPYNLTTAMAKAGRRFAGVDASISAAQKSRCLLSYELRRARLLESAKQIRSGGEARSDYHWWPTTRLLKARLAASAERHVRPDWTLHFTPMALSAHVQRQSRRAVYLDSTFRTLSKLADVGRYGRAYDEMVEAELLAFQAVDRFLTTTRYVADDLIDSGVPANKVVHVGVGSGRPRPRSTSAADASPICLFVARNSFVRKGGREALMAFRGIRRQRPEAELHLVVAPQTALTVLPAPAGVELHVDPPQALLDDLFRRSNVLLMPALNEPLGLVNIEAMASGLLVAGLDRHFVGELAAKGCALAAVDAHALGDLVVSTFEDAATHKRVQDRADAFVANSCDWGVVAEKVARVLDEA